jgi:glycosyltransferase involved in cell wall biosynthesis
MSVRPISYLLICHSYPPVLGGSEIEAQRISDALQKRGHRPRIVCAGGSPMPDVKEWVDPCGLRVLMYGSGSGSWRDKVYALGVAWTLLKERREYEMVYFLMQGLHLATGLPVAGLLGKPIIMKFSGSGIIRDMSKSWMGRLELAFLRRWAYRILVLNPGMVEEALQAGFEQTQLGWMPNPVDTDYFRPCAPEERVQSRRELGVSVDTPLVIFIGRLAPEKKLPSLLGAFARVVRELPQAVLALIGDGPRRAEIRELAAKLKLERNVVFAGRVPTSGVVQWLRAADAFALVSELEGLPCSLIEAMSAGVPVVVSNIPANTQLVDDEVDGLVAELGNEESIARGLLRVLDDRALRDRMGAAARQRMVDQFSMPLVVERYETLFAECTDGKRGP